MPYSFLRADLMHFLISYMEASEFNENRFKTEGIALKKAQFS